MKIKNQYSHSINVKLLTIVFVGIISFAAVLTVVSSFFILSCFNDLYREKLSGPSRTLLAQYAHSDISKYVDILSNIKNFAAMSKAYLADREYVDKIDSSGSNGASDPEYSAARTRMLAYINKFSKLKDDKYYVISKSLMETRISTGVKYLYIMADIGLENEYVCVFNTFYQADTGILPHDDFGTVVSKADYPRLAQAYAVGIPVYVIDELGLHGKISRSFTPITDGYGNVVAVICVEVNLESISGKLNSFLLYCVAITVLITAVLILLMLFMLQKTIIRPVKSLTSVSSEIAEGNVYAKIPQEILGRKDEMGVLGNSYEAMRAALEKLISNNESLFEAVIIGKLDSRGDPSQFSGLFARLIDSMNDTLNVIGLYFDSIPTSFAILNPDCDIVFTNKNFKETFASISTSRFFQGLLEDPCEDLGCLKAKLTAALKEGEFDCLRWFEIGDEKRCYSFMCSSVAQGEDKSGAVIVILDNTELVLAKDKALSANRAKTEFLSRISHELRTPLNAIISMAKLGLTDDELSRSMKRFEKIVSSSAHLSNIINDVLEMSRMESGKTEIRYAPMNVSGLVDECVDMLQSKALENNNELLHSVDPGIPARLIGDEFRIRQIILNLLSNAIKFTKDGKISIDVVCVEKSDQDYLLRFSVADTGIGMSEEFLGKIFTPFEQEDNFLSRRYVGSGLGLSISHNLVALMDGSMEVRSKLGEGSRFVFTLPFKSIAENQPDSLKNGDFAEDDVSIAGKKLLLVDDIEINRAIVIELLSDCGVDIDEAADGEEAVGKFMNSPPYYYDCILMDIQMPKLDGYNATQSIRRSRREDCDVPIVAMTANALKEDIDRALESGMDDHLAKPIDFELCIKTVRKYCTKNPRVTPI